jgi:FkbM family methyltransferase
MPKEYEIGRYKIVLPDDHALDRYQSVWRRYDTALGHIAKIVIQKYPATTAIDIGANVGDSAALIQKYQEMPVLCVEGNPAFLEYLRHNAGIIGNTEIAEYFVGTDGESVDIDRIRNVSGTASIVQALGSNNDSIIKTKSLEKILEEYSHFQNSKLLKIDTDGFDFEIIQASIDVVSNMKPIIYFEYDISFTPTGEDDALQALGMLCEVGYKKFIVYDNFGNYLISLSEQDYEKFIDLNAYLLSNRLKSGTSVVYYFDICAFTNEDVDLYEKHRFQEIRMLLS